MKRILVFAGSNSSTSINRTLARYAASRLEGVEKLELDLNDYEMPLYSADREKADGVPAKAISFHREVSGSDGLVLSLAEHNGSYTAAFKNLFDWTSRHESKVWADNPMLLLSTSPGGRGGAGVMAAALATFPRLGANIAAHFSLPSFGQNFDREQGIVDGELRAGLDSAVAAFRDAVG